MKNKPKRPRLKDVALNTGYSVNTVSRALRGMQDISEETQQKIRAEAEKIGYYNNTLASSLRLGHTHTVAVIIPDVSNVFFSFAMEEIERRAREKGYSTILLNTSESGIYEKEAIRTALQKNVDGIIFGPSQNSFENTKLLAASGIPFILFARRILALDTDYVVGDDVNGGYVATKHLIENGHKNIVMLNAFSAHNSAAQERQDGYEKALKEYGLPLQKDLLCQISAKGNESVEFLIPLLKRRKDVTAIFAYSDLVAWSAMGCLQENGYKIPEDISLVGFDNIRSCLNIPVPLTSVDNHNAQLAQSIWEALLVKMKNPDTKTTCRKVMPTDLSVGKTVKNINK